jgi:hypothetical protein
MNGRVAVRLALIAWCFTALAVLWRSIGQDMLQPDPRTDDAPQSVTVSDQRARTADIDRITGHNLFNPSRQPMAIRPPRTIALTVVGLLMAPRPSAIVRGIPGYEASQILAPGDSLGAVMVLSVAPDAVLARVGGDTLSLPFLRGER